MVFLFCSFASFYNNDAEPTAVWKRTVDLYTVYRLRVEKWIWRSTRLDVGNTHTHSATKGRMAGKKSRCCLNEKETKRCTGKNASGKTIKWPEETKNFMERKEHQREKIAIKWCVCIVLICVMRTPNTEREWHECACRVQIHSPTHPLHENTVMGACFRCS